MVAVRAHRRRRLASALFLVLVLGACTPDEPAPVEPPEDEEPEESPAGVGRDVAVILPPTDQADEAFLDDLQAQLVAAEDLLGGRVDTVTTHVPSSVAFIGDLARSFAERGVAVVCVIGPDGVEQLRGLVTSFPAVEFCAIDGQPVSDRDPEGLRRVVLRTEELGHTVGVTARLEAGDGGIVGLVLSGDAVAPGRFRAGLLAGLGDIEVVEADVPEGVEATPVERLEAVLAAGATQVIVDGAPDMVAAVAAIDGRAGVLGPQEVLAAAGLSLDEVGGDTIVIADWRLRWVRTLVGPVGALGDDGLRPRSLGLVSLATMRLGPATAPATREQIQSVRAAFGRGERDALEPVVDPAPAQPELTPPDPGDPGPDLDPDADPDADGAPGANDAGGDGAPPADDTDGAADGAAPDDG